MSKLKASIPDRVIVLNTYREPMGAEILKITALREKSKWISLILNPHRSSKTIGSVSVIYTY
jgi:hypothetical protein